MKAFVKKLGLGMRTIEGKGFDMFSRSKEFLEENCGNE
jgi:hypothetical protein